PAVEQPSVGVDERAGADACHQRPALLEVPQARTDLLVAELRARAPPAGVDERVDLAQLIPGGLGDDAPALRTRHRRSGLSDHHDLDVVGVEEPPGGEHLPWPGEVKL